jgi:hypothetical protein
VAFPARAHVDLANRLHAFGQTPRDARNAKKDRLAVSPEPSLSEARQANHLYLLPKIMYSPEEEI